MANYNDMMRDLENLVDPDACRAPGHRQEDRPIVGDLPFSSHEGLGERGILTAEEGIATGLRQHPVLRRLCEIFYPTSRLWSR
jgi:hypothetical protein